jgi:hypothetical protein
MPLLFSYGSLQQEDVQFKTFGRRLVGQHDALVGFEPSQVSIDDPRVATALGRTHHANVTSTGSDASRVHGMAFDITDAEFAGVDAYELAYCYQRVTARLASGREAWVYVHVPDTPAAR